MKKFPLKTLLFSTLSVGAFFLSSCAALFEPAQPPPVKYAPNFDFKPPTSTQVRSAGVSIALMNPMYANSQAHQYFDASPYSTFIKNMGNDFEELVTAKGFSIRGPFKDRDEMVYGDKKNSDIALYVSIELDDEGALQLKRYGTATQYTRPYYKVSGTYYHLGSLVLTACNPINGEKFWKKSVELPKVEIQVQGYKRFYEMPTERTILSDIGVYNPVAKALEQYYSEALEMAWRHISVEEFQIIAKEIRQANSKQ